MPRYGCTSVKYRRTRITIETQRVVLLSGRPQGEMASCSLCGSPTRWVTPDAAAAILGVSSLNIYRRVEDQTLHSFETSAGLLLICFTSLCENATTDLTSESISDS